MTLSYRLFWSFDGRRMSLQYLSAGSRYTTCALARPSASGGWGGAAAVRCCGLWPLCLEACALMAAWTAAAICSSSDRAWAWRSSSACWRVRSASC